jgi:hypothetical protein
MQGAALAEWLRSAPRPDQPAYGYFRRASKVVDAAWQTSVSQDFRLAHVTGDRPRGHRAKLVVSDLISRATMRDPVVARRFSDVVNMRARPWRLLTPPMLGRAARACLLPDSVSAEVATPARRASSPMVNS